MARMRVPFNARSLPLPVLMAVQIALQLTGFAQQPISSTFSSSTQTGTADIRGRVTAADNGAPIRLAEVRLSATSFDRTALTDEEGRYELRELPPGRYSVTVAKSGFATVSYGQRAPRELGRTVEVRSNESLEKVDVALPRGGTIVARVLDDFGAPYAGVNVAVEAYQYASGFYSTTATRAPTNDLGKARIGALSPGDYYVYANPSATPIPALDASDSGRRFALTYYPGTWNPGEAQVVTIKAGQVLQLNLPLSAFRPARISGVVQVPPSMLGNFTLTLIRETGETVTALATGASGFQNRVIPTDRGGRFVVDNVLPGSYALIARPATSQGTAPQTMEYGRTAVKVGVDDISDLVVTPRPPASLSGRIVFDGGGAPNGLRPITTGPSNNNVTVSLSNGPVLLQERSIVRDDWTFESTNVVGIGTLGLYRLPAGWYVKSVTIAGKDVTDTPLDFHTMGQMDDVVIALTQKPTVIAGTVMSGNAPLDGAAVVVFPEARERWRYRSASILADRTDEKGRFTITGLPAGQYLAAAVERLEREQIRDPRVLETLQTRAVRISVDDGQTVNIDLKVVAP